MRAFRVAPPPVEIPEETLTELESGLQVGVHASGHVGRELLHVEAELLREAVEDVAPGLLSLGRLL